MDRKECENVYREDGGVFLSILFIIPSIPAPHVTLVLSIPSSLLHDRTTCLSGLVAFLHSRYFFLPSSCYFFLPPSLPPDYRCLPPSSHVQFDSGNASFTSFNHLLPTFAYFSSFLFFFKMGGILLPVETHPERVGRAGGPRSPLPPSTCSIIPPYSPMPLLQFPSLSFLPFLTDPYLSHSCFFIHSLLFLLSVPISASPTQSPLFILPLVGPLPSPVPSAPTVPRAVVL